MKKSLKVRLLATAIAAALPSWVHAAGLGGINVFSALGQPLRAEIELHATPEELDGMRAVIASVSAFQQANVPYSSLLTDLQLTVQQDGTRPVVRVTSSRAINEPFVDLLVELSWASGRLVREYTFLLDPIEARQAPAASAAPAIAPRPATVTAAPAPAARPAVAQARSANASVHTVRRGETLHRIASDFLPPGAQLEQMLIALLRANDHAFIDGNINQLRAGAQLNIPDAAAVSAISAQDARAAVRAQRSDFEAYRRRAAAAVAEAPASPAPEVTRESAGTVAPRVEELVTTEDASSDRVQVSGGDTAVATGADGESSAATTPASEEELHALERGLQERDQRIEALERTVADLQRALEISNAALARLQEQGLLPAEATTPPVAVAPAAAAAASEEPPARRAPPPPPPAAPAPSLVDQILGNPLFLALGALLVGLLALLGIRMARRRREEQAFDASQNYESELPRDSLSVVSQPGGERVDTDSGSSVMDSDFSQTGLSAIDADEGVDPVAEADVYLAYGRDAQAEEILLDALKVDASRHAIYLKLLEVYLQRGDRRQFEVIATDLYSRTGGEGGDWLRACSMGRKLDPENPLYGASAASDAASGGAGWGAAAAGVAVGAAAGAAYAATRETDEEPSVEAEELAGTEVDFDTPRADPLPSIETPEASTAWIEPAAELAEEPVEAVEEREPLDFDLPLEAAAAPSEVEEEVKPLEDDDNLLAFDLDLGDDPAASIAAPSLDVPAEVTEDAPEAFFTTPEASAEELQDFAAGEPSLEEPTYMDLERTEFDANLLDFDLDLSPPPAEAPALPPSLDLTSIDLDLDLNAQQADAPAAPAAAAPSESAVVPQFADEDLQREMDTKLELARAYDEMGDREGARELLEEVVKEGSDEQREAAARMLERLA